MKPLPKSIYFTGALAIIYLAMVPLFMGSYFIADATTWMSLLLLPFILRIEWGRKSGLRFFWFAIFFLIFSISTGIATFFFFAIGFALLFLIDHTVGRINWPPVFLLGLLCPAFKYFTNIFGFAIRLRLSEIVGNTLQLAGFDVQVNGNMMVMNQCEFSVDPACVGLKMMSVSMLAGLFILAYFERSVKRNFRFVPVLLVITSVVILNVFSNLFRILLLVIFKILPENPAHDLIGILCLVLYVIIPSYFIIKRLSPDKTTEVKPSRIRKINCRKATIHALLLISIITARLATPEKHVEFDLSALPGLKLSGFNKTIIDKDVVKYEKPGILIYVKPIRFFYGTDHNPMICWKGSGYEFKKIRELEIGKRKVYAAVLERGQEKLYTAWWYDNGKYCTINQTDWRWRAFKGGSFNLVNISCGTEEDLLRNLNLMIDKD